MQNENDLIRMRFSSKELSSHSAKYKVAIDERDRDRQLPDRFLSIMSSICRVILTFKSVSATSSALNVARGAPHSSGTCCWSAKAHHSRQQ